MSDAGDELRDLLDDDDDDDGASFRTLTVSAAMPAPIVAHLPFLAAASKLKSSLLDRVGDLITGHDVGILLTGSAGVGKTESMLAAAEMMLDRAQLVVWATSTIEMAHETEARAAGRGIHGIVLHGRNASTCDYMDKVLVSRAEGYAPGAFVCPSCPKHPDNLPGRMMEMNTCEHYARLSRARRAIKHAKDMKTRLPLIITTYENAVAGLKHAPESRQGEIWKTKQIFFDEDPSRAMRERAVLSDDDLTRTPHDKAPSNFLRILSMARAIAADQRMEAVASMSGRSKNPASRSISHDFDGSSISGRELHYLLYSAVNALDLDADRPAGTAKKDLLVYLREASDWSPRIGKGEMFYADRSGFLKYVANAFLPKFAGALHGEIFRDDTNSIPGTYEVRLDSVKGGGWQFILDRLEPFHSGRDNVVIGDAYADKDFVGAMFGVSHETGGRQMFTIDVRVALPDNVRVLRSMSAKTTKRVLGTKESLHHLLDTEVSTVLQAEAGRRVLVYTQKGHRKNAEDWFAENGATYQLAEIAFEHYWSGRGKDQYKNFDSIICIGEPVPNLLGLLHEANALHPGKEAIVWSPDSKKIWSQDPRLERVWNMLAVQELSQALMRIRPGMPSTTDKRMYIFGKHVDLPVDFIHALHWNGTVAATGDAKVQEGDFEPLSPEQVRDYILWVFQVTGCWCHPFLASLCKRGTATAPTAGGSEPIENVLRPPPRAEVRLSWLRSQFCVRRGVELAEKQMPPPTPLRTSWMRKSGPAINVFGDVSRASQLLEVLYQPDTKPGRRSE